MNSEKFGEQNKFVKHWNLNLILGIIYILVSMWIFAKPEIIYISLAIIFIITLLFTGVLGIISSIQYKNLLHGWRWSLAVGSLNLLVVIKVILKPQISTEALILIMGFVFLYHSVNLITWSTELKNYEARNLGWVLFGSIAGVMLSFLLIWNRTFPKLTLLFFTSFALLLIGISEIYFSFVLRKKIELPRRIDSLNPAEVLQKKLKVK
jgi:uncharacterized membrane protein HdeD (DUF308 family)